MWRCSLRCVLTRSESLVVFWSDNCSIGGDIHVVDEGLKTVGPSSGYAMGSWMIIEVLEALVRGDIIAQAIWTLAIVFLSVVAGHHHHLIGM